jgi:hypothetical protein
MLVLLAGCGEGTVQPVEEPQPYPPLDDAAYCAYDDPTLLCWSLTDRQQYLERLEGRDFGRDPEGWCALTEPRTGHTMQFQCGALGFALMEGVVLEDLDRVLALTGGEITRFPGDLHDFGKLRVPVGTEVSGIRKTIFNPDLRFISLNRANGVANSSAT